MNYEFTVIITSDTAIDSEFVETAILHFCNDDNNYKEHENNEVDVTYEREYPEWG